MTIKDFLRTLMGNRKEKDTLKRPKMDDKGYILERWVGIAQKDISKD